MRSGCFIKKYLIAIAIVLVCLILLSMMWNVFRYHIVYYFMLYDYIEYNGTKYYFVDVSIDMKVDFNSMAEVHLGCILGNTLFDEYTETAHKYVGDTKTEYLYFDSKTWSNNIEIASEYYD